ncbi:recombination protein NinB [Paenalcaligenes hominis]|uniref:recombination protein NinB n=1 Tax=Paenalcaligenes hominis TaxID=643674 RepID=UPI0035252207
MSRRIFHLVNDSVRRNARQAVLEAPENYLCEIRQRTRSLDQNNLMWAVLTDLSRQVLWPVNGVKQRLSSEDWKSIITASLHEENRMAQGINGGFVLLGKSTSRMSIKEMTEVIEFAHAFGAERGVKWSPTAIGMGL